MRLKTPKLNIKSVAQYFRPYIVGLRCAIFPTKLTLSVSVLESRPTHILSVVSQGETFSLPLLFEQQQKICLNNHCPAFMRGGKNLESF